MLQDRQESTYSLFDVLKGKACGEMWVQGDDGGLGEDLSAVNHGRDIVANNLEDTHDELEVALHLHLVVCDEHVSACQEAVGGIVTH